MPILQTEMAKRLVRWQLSHTAPAPLALEHPVQEDLAAAADEIERLNVALSTTQDVGRDAVAEIARYICRQFICCASNCKECGYGSAALEHAKAIAALRSTPKDAVGWQAMREAATKLVMKLDFIHQHPAYKAVWEINQTRTGRPYQGPNYEHELKELRAALEAAQPLPAPPEAGWRGIETAPRDGTWILLAYVTDAASKNFACVGRHNSNDVWVNDIHATIPKPTHWQPLAAPPATAKQEQENARG